MLHSEVKKSPLGHCSPTLKTNLRFKSVPLFLNFFAFAELFNNEACVIVFGFGVLGIHVFQGLSKKFAYHQITAPLFV